MPLYLMKEHFSFIKMSFNGLRLIREESKDVAKVILILIFFLTLINIKNSIF